MKAAQRGSCRLFAAGLLALAMSGCAETVNSEPAYDGARGTRQTSISDLATGSVEPLSSAQLQEKAGEVAENWFYGQGIGETMLNVGTVVLFPPYGLYLLGRGALTVAGVEEPPAVTDALPEGARQGVNEAYDAVTSVPGKITSGIAGEEFRGQ